MLTLTMVGEVGLGDKRSIIIGDVLKKFVLFAFGLLLLLGFWFYSIMFTTVATYQHPASVEFYKTGIMDRSDYNGPAGSDVFSTVSVSKLPNGYKIWVNFHSKTTGHKIEIRSVELKSKTLDLYQEFSEVAYIEIADDDFFDAHKMVFDSLDESKFPPSVRHFNLSVVYDLDGQTHDVVFKVKRREIGVPIH